MADLLSPEHASWLEKFTGIKLASSDPPPAAQASTAPGEPAPAASPAPAETPAPATAPAPAPAPAPVTATPASPVVPFDKTFPLPKVKRKVAGGRVDIELAVSVKLTGKAFIDSKDATQVDGTALEQAAKSLASTWSDGTFAQQVTGATWSDLNVKRDGLALTASTAAKTSVGTFTMTFTFAKIDKELHKDASVKVEPKLAAASIEFVGVPTPLPDTEIQGLRLTSLVAAPTASGEVQPDCFGMIEKWAEDRGVDVLKKIAEDLAIEITGDVVISGALVIGGAAAIAGSIYSVVMAWGIGDLAKSYTPSIDAAHGGFKAGMAGATPPGDQFGKIGFDAGQKNRNDLAADLRTKNQGAPDDNIFAAIAGVADKAAQEAQAAIESAVRRGLWDGYLKQHTSVLMYDDARYAFVACFGYDQKFDHGAYDAEFQSYVKQHPKMAALGM